MESFLSNINLLFPAAEQSASGGSAESMGLTIVTIGAVFLIFYFLIVRPQNKKKKETESMISNLAKNDKIVTIGGIYGTVQSVKENTVIIKVDDNTKLEFSKNAISNVLERKNGKTNAAVSESTEKKSEN